MVFNDKLNDILPDKIQPRAGCMVLHNGKVLVIITEHGYEFPKGKIKQGENSNDAAMRETYEETGISCSILHETPIETINEEEGYSSDFFTAIKTGGNMEPQTSENILDCKWVGIQELVENLIKWQKPLIKSIDSSYTSR